MKKIIALSAALFAMAALHAQDWKMVPGRISSSWAETVTAANPLPAYPRPQMVRNDWTNLNGLWLYAIVPATKKEKFPARYDGNILVPFAVESALSGVSRTVGKDSVLWYKRTITAEHAGNTRLLLHFGAVDWLCDVFVNGKQAGSHKGGYDPFEFDITSYLNSGREQEIMVRVWDPTDDGPQPRGKQVKNPRGIWYTPVTGIWQTVWLESVPATYISSFKQVPDIDNAQLTVAVSTEKLQPGDQVKLVAYDGGKQIADQTASGSGTAILKIPAPKLWSPGNPFLYDLKISVLRNGKPVDEVKGYFAMRKISTGKDRNGVQRMLLNNEFVFQYGPLDQGWWP
ncbi:MAG: beta-galactosidase, partial [Chitinophagaceae bacterium]|nr:beta-galactosidase [Chitinophagaceae bacterium]